MLFFEIILHITCKSGKGLDSMEKEKEVRKQKYSTKKVGFSFLHMTNKSVTLQQSQEWTGKLYSLVHVADNLA